MKAVVSYHESSLYESELQDLRGTGWLSANVIDFYLCYLEHDKYGGRLESAGVLLVHPATLFIIAMTDEPGELAEFLEPLGMADKRVVFLPVNNETQRDLAGHPHGTHWSLLVYERASNRFRHWDSYRGANNGSARAVAAKLKTVLGCAGEPSFEAVADAPQQVNGRDCGLYVCCNIDAQLGALLGNAAPAALTPEHVAAQRAAIHALAIQHKRV